MAHYTPHASPALQPCMHARVPLVMLPPRPPCPPLLNHPCESPLWACVPRLVCTAQVQRIVLQAEGLAGVVCALREVVVEIVLKVEEGEVAGAGCGGVG